MNVRERVDSVCCQPYVAPRREPKVRKMKVLKSLRSAKKRERGCQIVRRRGRVYVINKRNPRFKARQG